MTISSKVATSNKWTDLEHNGVAFPPEYVQRGINVKILGEIFFLNREQEELIYAWAKKKDTHYVKDPVFQGNFLSDFKKLLPERFTSVRNIDEIDMTEAFSLVDKEFKIKENEKIRIKSLTRDERRRISQEKKLEKEKLKAIYGKAKIDGIEVDVANWLVEPPGIFMGRGLHPLRGRWKPRVTPKDVTLNLGQDASAPEGPWKAIVHDHYSTWLASWIENLTGKRKYVWLHDSSYLRQDNDKAKYDTAKKLEYYISDIEKEIINQMLNSKDVTRKKIATVCYLIYKLAMRVGDEKDTDEADTIGASTLRVEHLKFPKLGDKVQIEFNFLGKDSVPWQKTLEISSPDTKALYENLLFFMKGKNKSDEIFEDITSSKVNKFLRSIDKENVPNLTAKVFRTCIATAIVKQHLSEPILKVNKNESEFKKVYVAKIANLQAAITCNHKKGIDPKNPASKKAWEKFEQSLENKKEKIKQLRMELKEKKWKTELQKLRKEQRVEKLEFQLRLQKETRDYNLGTSLRNYIDPRVFKSWCDYVDLDWTKIYTSTLQRKFKWIEQYSKSDLKKYLSINNRK
ncbi:MAG: DNA topoisomerase I [Nitrososphaeraceae archaeon]|nr:DNA topoisomerase I [Nitrososphaeraceae archaeon]MDW0205250.1 DNA topoisomerase I [Nitrososphaeraceae archaeon]MDW0253501.1 DNA topoisomerase I [Nitrososphaeraceae archaeon]MDW0261266.1 DNA topoisomerase I [Nitrososphaeraceae archaeon]MDW0276236.1 DNA topoisomerase I [Nitrososphaeraceae archaeon]